MFEALFDLTKKFKSLDSNKFAVSVWFDKDIQTIILKMNRIDQLAHQGINSEDEVIGVYAPITDITYDGQEFEFEGQTYEKIAFQPYNFVVTGEFFRSFKVVVYKDGFTIVADTKKDADDLAIKFGKNILGLTEENIHVLAKKMLPLFIEQVRKHIFA